MTRVGKMKITSSRYGGGAIGTDQRAKGRMQGRFPSGVEQCGPVAERPLSSGQCSHGLILILSLNTNESSVPAHCRIRGGMGDFKRLIDV